MRSSGAIVVSRAGRLGRADFAALGTGVVVVATDPASIAAAALAVRAELEEVDAACSRFRPDSELEVANRAGGRQVAVGPLLAEAIAVALRAAELTGGAVDPTIGASLRALGYDRDFDEVRGGDGVLPVVGLVPLTGWRSVRFNRRWGTLQMPVGMRLDLGATAKALAADRAARRAADAAACGVLVSAGGDISTAGPPPATGWSVKISNWHASHPSCPGPTVRIEGGGLATSSTSVRRWVRGGTELHHIVDPASGRPAETVWRTVSVAAASCVDANTASTAAIVKGEGALPWLASTGLPARLVRPDGTEVCLGGWPADDGRAAA